MHSDLVLVTGGSGFIGGHCILQLIRAGYRVRTTLRSAKREPEVRALIERQGIDPITTLSFAQAELCDDAGWAEAMAGCTYVLHVASPFPSAPPRNQDEVVLPARAGMLRVLRSARDAGVRRVVVTSSLTTITQGRQIAGRAYTEADWTEPGEPALSAYVRSKTLAERDAWTFVAEEKSPELAIINPAVVLGPVLGPDYSPSVDLVWRLLSGALPLAPRLYYSIVDVRDVVDLQIRAMTNPIANGERFIAVAGNTMSILEIGQTLRASLGDRARHVPRWQMPNWAMRLLALASPTANQVKDELDVRRVASSAKARSLLGWSPRSNQEAIIAAGESLLGLRFARTGS